jgi:hypothetical protein
MALLHHMDALISFSNNGNEEYKPDSVPSTSEDDDITRPNVNKMMDHMKVLLEFVKPYYEKFMSTAGDRLTKLLPSVTYSEAWYLFPPGTDVYVETVGGEVLAAVVLGSRFDTDDYELEVKVWYLIFDGKELQRRSSTVYVDHFSNLREITSLEIYPAKIWDIKDGGRRRKAFESRGETAFQLCQGKFKQAYYHGPDEDGELVCCKIVKPASSC